MRVYRHLRAGISLFLVLVSPWGRPDCRAPFLWCLSALRLCVVDGSWLAFALVVRLPFPARAESGDVIFRGLTLSFPVHLFQVAATDALGVRLYPVSTLRISARYRSCFLILYIFPVFFTFFAAPSLACKLLPITSRQMGHTHLANSRSGWGTCQHKSRGITCDGRTPYRIRHRIGTPKSAQKQHGHRRARRGIEEEPTRPDHD